ncbi:MAG: sialidase family protein [bacterium]
MRAILFAALSIAALVVAGCSGNNGNTSTSSTDTTPPLPAPGQVPVVHRADGVIVDASQYPGDIPVMAEHYVAKRGSGEPTIGVNARGAAIYPSIEFDAVAAMPGAAPRTLIYISTDNGTTWTDRTPTIGNAGAVAGNPVSLDPFVYADPATGRLFTIDLYVGCADLSYTDDDGVTWTTNPIACGIPVDDHQSIAAGPVVAPAVPNPVYPRVLYYCVNQIAATSCSRSLDGGLDWVAGAPPYPGATSGQGEGGQPDFCGGLSGHVYASQKTGTVFLPKGQCGFPEVARSTDMGTTWTQVVVDGTAGISGHDGSVAADANGTVYYFWLDGQGFPRLAVSHDDGQTFEASMNVTAPGVTAAKFPAVTAGDGGRIAFLYVGSTVPGGFTAKDAALANATWNGYLGFSLDADKPDPVFASVTANPVVDPLKRGACAGRCSGMFDFFDIQIHPKTGQVWVSLVDLCNDTCATPTGTAKDTITSRGAVGVQMGGTMLRRTPVAG